MSLHDDASTSRFANLPALADEIARSLARIARLPEELAALDAEGGDIAPLADAARALSEVQGALLIIDEQGLAAMVQLLRAQLLACRDNGNSAGSVSPQHVARNVLRLQTMMRAALDALIAGRRPRAGELLACWQQLAASGGAYDMHASALVSLRLDADRLALLPPTLSAKANDGSEQALLSFLRVQDDAQRAAAALSIADALAHAYGNAIDADERARWLALRAWLIEFAQANGDAGRAKKIVAAIARALRHVGEGAAVNAAPARDALFELAQLPLLTDEAREVAQLFDLKRQFAAPAACSTKMLANDVADAGFAAAIVNAIATVEAQPERVDDSSLWLALADATTGSDRYARLTAQLREIAASAEGEAADPAAHEHRTAILLCIHACTQDGGAGHSAADPSLLAEALRAAQPVQGLQAWSRSAGARQLMRDLAATLRSEMQHAEQALDGGMAADAARALAIGTLDRIAGALQMLALDASRDAVLRLRSQLAAADVSRPGLDETLAQAWVALKETFVLFPWQLSEPASETAAEPMDAVAGDETSLLVDAGDDSLDAIFIEEAASLLRDLREQSARADVESVLHLAHTLAGCSATVGVAPIAALANLLEDALSRGCAPHPSLLRDTLDALDTMLAEFAASGSCSDAAQLVDRWRSSIVDQSLTALAEADRQDGEDPLAEAVNALASDSLGSAETQTTPNIGADASTGMADDVIVSASEPDINELAVPASPAYESASICEDADDGEAELLAIFNEEAADLLPQIEQAVRAWQRQPDDRQQPAQLLRVLHTLKGSARMAAQHALGEDFHRTEAEVAALMQQAPSSVSTQLPALLERVDQWLHAIAGSPVAPSVETDSDVDAGKDKYAGEAIVPVPSHATTDRASLLRVRADRLAQFADSSAEVWVGNSRIREGLQEQRRAVADLSDDLARLRAQLRELEIEAESRILSQAVQGSASDFDPLEFDCYTRLHELTRMMAESITDIAGVQRGLARQVEGLGSAASAQARDLRRLQSELQALRSQALQSVEGRLRHLLRQAAREAGREVELVIEGGEVEIERSLLERLMGPLEHLLRNAVVHGIEPPDERVRLDKSRIGKITLQASLAGNELRLQLADDGRGLDLQRIRDRAIAVGLLHEHDACDAQALATLIFEPGFSTASEVTALSGRGIGMDVVRVELQALGGRIDIASEAGRGCRFSIRLPASLASVPVILANAGRWRVALPATMLQQVLQLDPSQIRREADECQIDWQGNAIRLLRLGSVLGDASPPADNARVAVAVLRDGERRLAVQLDAIAGQREVIIKHPGAQLAQVPGLAGATLLGDGGIALIIDPFRLPAIAPIALPVTESKRAPLVLVVDDSLTVRRASQRLLERHGYAVALARDGVEALEQLQQHRPAAVLLDIEMPRMDGFELLAALRDDARWRTLPVVMITSRIAERHRERATALGVTAYMGKPYDEDALLALLSQVDEAALAAA